MLEREQSEGMFTDKDEPALMRESEARYRIVMETTSDAIITVDEAGTILFVNRAVEKVFGYASEGLIGAPLTMLMPEYMRRLHEAGMQRYVETGRKHISWEGVELPGLHKDGRQITLEISFGEFAVEGRRFFTGIARDITGRKRAERHLAVQHAVTRILAEAPTVDDASPRLLQAICTELGWEQGALWSVDREAERLRCVVSWHNPSAGPGAAAFEAESRERSFARDASLPGRVWASGEPLWVEDIVSDGSFLRSELAARHGIHGAFAFPIRLGADVLGVMEYFSIESREPDAALLETMDSIGSHVGQFIERKRAEDERARLQDEMIRIQDAQLIELSTPMIPLTDDIAIMPLVGTLDAKRAEQMLRTLLQGVGDKRMAVAIIDITGVPVVDTHVANTLIQAAQSAHLLGTEVVLTGIRSGVARSLTGLGVELQGLVTRRNLQSGLAYALELLRRKKIRTDGAG